ncbi:MAG: hypothetical protein K5764_02575 [Prevotella sp.]|nr:hypothetical protein [Prevotella sp.]
MKCKLLLLMLALCCGRMSAQVVFSEVPQTTIEMDIEAKADVALLSLNTYSKVNQMVSGANVVMTLFDGTVLELPVMSRSSNNVMEGDAGHGFADKFHSRGVMKLTPEQAEKFQYGLKSIQIRMRPNSYFYEWTEDELGQPLYSRYLITKESVMFKTGKEKNRLQQ